ncbi:MAG: hypothetical protein EXX96DRAFT_541916 [Benjaminiella poitrasii]|nr:MAG: hypothetical protein EXX96DRAFT_541916 [Benjaminiella poitrasii]
MYIDDYMNFLPEQVLQPSAVGLGTAFLVQKVGGIFVKHFSLRLTDRWIEFEEYGCKRLFLTGFQFPPYFKWLFKRDPIPRSLSPMNILDFLLLVGETYFRSRAQSLSIYFRRCNSYVRFCFIRRGELFATYVELNYSPTNVKSFLDLVKTIHPLYFLGISFSNLGLYNAFNGRQIKHLINVDEINRAGSGVIV